MAFQVEGAYQGRGIAKKDSGNETSKFLPCMYSDPPFEDIALEEFEELAIDRLRGEFWLRLVESCPTAKKTQGKTLTFVHAVIP